MKNKITLFGLAAILVFAACSKDKDNNPTMPSNEDPPQLQMQSLTIPAKMQQSTDPHAQTVVFYMQMANIFNTSLAGYIHAPDGVGPTTREGNLWEYNWKQDALDIILRITDESDNFSWVTQFNGKDTEYDYHNWIAYRATQSKDEKSGSFTAYLPNTKIPLGEYIWSLDDDGALNFEVDASALQQGRTFEGVLNTDHSGTLHVFESQNGQNILIEKYDWDAEGVGQWWTYENGELKESGAWS